MADDLENTGQRQPLPPVDRRVERRDQLPTQEVWDRYDAFCDECRQRGFEHSSAEATDLWWSKYRGR